MRREPLPSKEVLHTLNWVLYTKTQLYRVASLKGLKKIHEEIFYIQLQIESLGDEAETFEPLKIEMKSLLQLESAEIQRTLTQLVKKEEEQNAQTVDHG
ncbi:hypothetical protein EOM86_10855 [Candidatus Nomurabacteria bacterium]|nr:hypothetical protein [Candidatus Nomurabacteria bacterium]